MSAVEFGNVRVGECAESAAPPAPPSGDQRIQGLASLSILRRGPLHIEERCNSEVRECVFPNGARYKGQWRDDLFHGQGECVFPNGARYKGQWIDGKRNGQGECVFPNGARYKGQWIDGKRNGKGESFDSDGGKYEGQWRDGLFHGQGKYIFADGSVYEGEWEDGKRNGQGEGVLPNGARYKGQWKDDVLYQGTIVIGKMQLEGEFEVLGSSYYLKKGAIWYNSYRIQVNMEEYNQSLLISFGFLLSLVGSPDFKSFEISPIRVLVGWLNQKNEFSNAVEILNSVARILQLSPDQLEQESKRICEKLQAGEACLLPFFTSNHAMGLNLVPDGETIICEIFNGDPSSQWERMECHPQHPQDPKKFQTMLRVRVPKAHITAEKIRQILSQPEHIRDAYALILNIPEAKIIAQENSIWQTRQKVGNCWSDWVFAYLKNTLEEAKYNHLRALLFADCLEQLQKAPDSYPNKEKLKKELERKIKKRYPRYMSLTR